MLYCFHVSLLKKKLNKLKVRCVRGLVEGAWKKRKKREVSEESAGRGILKVAAAGRKHFATLYNIFH